MSYRVLILPAMLLGLTLAAAAPAPAQDGQQSSQPRASIAPSEGATLTVVELSAEGLPGLSDVLVLAGPDPERLYPIERGATDPQGRFSLQLQVPEEAERGEPYYFAVDPAGEAGPVLAEPPFRVLVRENAAPGGA